MAKYGRRLLGLLLGAGMGLVYGVLAHYVNGWMLPGLSLYAAPPGRATSLILTVLAGSALGIVATWPANGLLGAALSGLLGALMVVAGTMVNSMGSQNALPSLIFLLFYTFLPMVVLFAPIGAIARWGVGKLMITRETEFDPAWKRFATPLLVLAAAAAVGSLAIYPGQVRGSLTSLDRIIRQGLTASERTALPNSLQTVEGFIQNARGSYTLEHSDEIELYQGPRPDVDLSPELSQYVVIVRFQNGFRFVCLFGEGIERPLCRNG